MPRIVLAKTSKQSLPAFTPSISGKTRGDGEKWLWYLDSASLNYPGTVILISVIFLVEMCVNTQSINSLYVHFLIHVRTQGKYNIVCIQFYRKLVNVKMVQNVTYLMETVIANQVGPVETVQNEFARNLINMEKIALKHASAFLRILKIVFLGQNNAIGIFKNTYWIKS